MKLALVRSPELFGLLEVRHRPDHMSCRVVELCVYIGADTVFLQWSIIIHPSPHNQPHKKNNTPKHQIPTQQQTHGPRLVAEKFQGGDGVADRVIELSIQIMLEVVPGLRCLLWLGGCFFLFGPGGRRSSVLSFPFFSPTPTHLHAYAGAGPEPVGAHPGAVRGLRAHLLQDHRDAPRRRHHARGGRQRRRCVQQ